MRTWTEKEAKTTMTMKGFKSRGDILKDALVFVRIGRLNARIKKHCTINRSYCIWTTNSTLVEQAPPTLSRFGEVASELYLSCLESLYETN